MKKMAIDEWGNAIFTKKFKVLNINYDNGYTIVLEVSTDITYRATYDKKTMLLELEEIHDDKES